MNTTVQVQDSLASATCEMARLLEANRIDHVLIGGLAVSLLGRPRHSRDIDFFIRQVDAERALEAAAAEGFETDPINPHWIYKAFKYGVQVDLIFKARRDVYLDDEMLSRSRRMRFRDCEVQVVSPEDLVVIKAMAHGEETARHWWDALSVIARGGLDWAYLERRALKGPHRVLSLLHYARSVGLLVPTEAVRSLSDVVFAAGTRPS